MANPPSTWDPEKGLCPHGAAKRPGEVCSRGHVGHVCGEGKPGCFAALRGLPMQLGMVRSEAGLLLGQGALGSVTWAPGRTEE